ncbi:MAG: pyridoxal phosphate-dependent aminotransferase [Saccharofermentanales bacterium]|mgnify:FL=1|jgi:aspartate aminotransferase|nr:pyridoxal phosphate-dependent aminotransferase [Bacillota bacterium]NLB08118.1 pyridoxal phosphate-dependent aminotransferase [Clostridiales bacterium]
MKISNRMMAMQASPIRRLVPFADAARKRGIKVYGLNVGQPDIETPPEFMDAIRNAEIKVLAYANSKGDPQLVKATSDYYKRIGLPYEPEDIIITNGGSEALMWAFIAVADVDEDILVPEPFYTNYRSFAAPYAVNIKPLTTYAENGFALPSEAEIVSKLTDKTRAIALSNPGNPTGVVYTREEVEMLAKIAKEHDLFIIADEVYREFTYEGLKATSFGEMTDILDRVIIVDSVSKRFSACGARIGSLATKNKELPEQILKLGQSRLCAPTLEMIGSTALYQLDPSYFDPIRERYQNRRDVLCDGLAAIDGVLCKKPMGAFYAIAKLPVKNAEDFAKWMLTDFNDNNETVMVAPVENFYQTPGMGVDEVRVAYVLKTDDLKRAVEILDKALKVYPDRV